MISPAREHGEAGDHFSVEHRVVVSLAEGDGAPALCVVRFAGSVHQLSCFTQGPVRLWEARALTPGVGPLCGVWIEDGWAGVRARNADALDSELIVATVHREGDQTLTEWQVPPTMPGWQASAELAEVLLQRLPAFDPPEVIAVPGGYKAAVYRPEWFAQYLSVDHDMWWMPWWLVVTDEAGAFLGSCEYKARYDDGIIEFGVQAAGDHGDEDLWVHPDGRFWALRSWPPTEAPITGRLDRPDEPEVAPVAVLLRALSRMNEEQWASIRWSEQG